MLLCLLTACSPAEPPTLAFYHWQTRFQPADYITERSDYQTLQRLYVKYFDVSWQAGAGALPQASIQWDHLPPGDTEVVPCIFMTNEVFQQISTPIALDSLASRIKQKITSLHPDRPLSEVQIDCDWSQNTRESYFLFLRKLKHLLPHSTQLSVTLRLHQLRYPTQTGIPPADRAMLMFYNMGQIDHWAEAHSILNLPTAAAYLDAPTYPLALDLALPLFRWGLVFREGELLRIINNLSAAELADTSRFLALGEQRYELRQSTYLGAYYVYRGDQIRLEQVQAADLRDAAALLRNTRSEPWQYLSFYHLDSTLLHDFSPETLDHIRHSF